MDRAHEFIGVRGDDRERAKPFLALGSLPVLPDTRQSKWLSIFHANGIGLLWHVTLDRFPLKEVVDGDKASAVVVCVAETREARHCFCLCVDRSPSTVLLAPVRDETPPKSIKYSLAGLRMLTDDPMLLARSAVVARQHMQRLDKIRDLEPELVRSGFLSEATAHEEKIGAWPGGALIPIKLAQSFLCVVSANRGKGGSSEGTRCVVGSDLRRSEQAVKSIDLPQASLVGDLVGSEM
jgi:hypothetical protein